MHFLPPSRFNTWGRGRGWQGKPLFQLALLETVAKFQTASWQMPKARPVPRRGQLLMRSLMQLQPGQERAWGAGGLDARLRLQLVSRWRLLNPSRQVHSTWAEGLRDPGRPGLTPSIQLGFSTEYCSQQSQKVGVQVRPGCPPDHSPSPPPRPDPKAWQGGAGAQAALCGAVLPACPLQLGLPPHPAQICLDLQEHTGGARHYLTANCSCWLNSWARRSRPEPLSLPFPAHAASRSRPQVARR